MSRDCKSSKLIFHCVIICFPSRIHTAEGDFFYPTHISNLLNLWTPLCAITFLIVWMIKMSTMLRFLLLAKVLSVSAFFRRLLLVHSGRTFSGWLQYVYLRSISDQDLIEKLLQIWSLLVILQLENQNLGIVADFSETDLESTVVHTV